MDKQACPHARSVPVLLAHVLRSLSLPRKQASCAERSPSGGTLCQWHKSGLDLEHAEPILQRFHTQAPSLPCYKQRRPGAPVSDML